MFTRKVDLWMDERGAFETVELMIGERELFFPSYSLPLLHSTIDTHDEFTLQITDERSEPQRVLLVRLPSLGQRDSLHTDLKRQARIAAENRLVEEADELMANFEERLYDDIPSSPCCSYKEQ